MVNSGFAGAIHIGLTETTVGQGRVEANTVTINSQSLWAFRVVFAASQNPRCAPPYRQSFGSSRNSDRRHRKSVPAEVGEQVVPRPWAQQIAP